ncbi:MAG: type I methionyl aminopeptidase [Alphaproteobacteria bacterium]
MTIKLHSKQAFANMKKSGQLAAQVLDYLTPHIVEGVSTNHIDQLAHDFIIKHKAIPAPLHYKGYPKSICTSVNHVVCHGVPDENKILQAGDILNVDVTVILDGWYGDTSRIYWVGDVALKAQKLTHITYQAMMAGIDAVKPDGYLGDIGAVIESMASQHRYSVVRDFCGHGIGQIFHDEPNVLHYGKKGSGAKLRTGMFFTIEPMLNIGSHEVKLLQDGWTAVTRDKSLSAQFEHTVAVGDHGVEIFTQSPDGLHHPPY